MSEDKTTKHWDDSATGDESNMSPEHPAGMTELSEDELAQIQGGHETGVSITDPDLCNPIPNPPPPITTITGTGRINNLPTNNG